MKKPRRKRRDKRRDRNLEQLMEAALEIVRCEGMASLSPTRVSRAAGLHKRAFYAHFTGIDECRAQVVSRIGTGNVASEVSMHREALRTEPYDLDVEVRALEATLRNAVTHRSTYQLLSRHRYDEGVLGLALRANIAVAIEEVTEMLWDLGLRHGLGARHLKDVARLALLVTEQTLAGIARVVETQRVDIGAEAALLARGNHALVTGELTRMLTEPGSAASA